MQTDSSKRSNRAGRIAAGAGVSVALAGALTLAQAGSAFAATTYVSDTFTQPTTTAAVTTLAGSSTGFPCLTAGTGSTGSTVPGCNLATPDAAGAGTLRLTDANQNESAALISSGSFPLAAGFKATFTQYQYGGNAADGISFDLTSAPPTSGGFRGGSLGYNDYGGDNQPQGTGLSNGYLGIGLDAFGNYSRYSGPGCSSDASRSDYGFNPNEVVVRGPGNGSTGYCLLTSSKDLAADPLGANGFQLRAGSRAASARTVAVTVDPVAKTLTVGIDPAGGSNFVTVSSAPLPNFYYDANGLETGTPANLSFAIASSTGNSTDIHEISNLTTSAFAATAPAALPESPLALAFPVAGLAAVGVVAARRRRRA